MLHRALLTLWAVACVSLSVADDAASSGGAHVLTEANFASSIESGKWLVKFYAPWCGHCQKMAPAYDELARTLHGTSEVNVGKIDCTSTGSICADLGIQGFPTLMYMEDNGAIKIKFHGARDVPSMVDFVNTASRDPIVELTKDQLEAAKKEHQVVFALILADSSSDVLKTYTQVAKNMIMSAKMFTTRDTSVLPAGQSAPAIVVFKDGETVAYDGEDIKTASTAVVEKWCRNARWPKYFELTRDGVAALQEEQPKLHSVIAVIDPQADNAAVHATMRELADKELPEGWEYKFVWLDGEKMKPIVKRLWGYDTEALPKLVVQLTKTMEYWVPENDSKFPDVDSAWQFLADVHAGRIKTRGGRGFMAAVNGFVNTLLQSVDSVFAENPMLANAALLCMLLCGFVWLRNTVNRVRSRVNAQAQAQPQPAKSAAAKKDEKKENKEKKKRKKKGR